MASVPGRIARMANSERAQEVVLRLITVRQAADSFKVSERSIRRMLLDGSLPFVRLGRSVRIRPQDLTDFVEARTVPKNG